VNSSSLSPPRRLRKQYTPTRPTANRPKPHPHHPKKTQKPRFSGPPHRVLTFRRQFRLSMEWLTSVAVIANYLEVRLVVRRRRSHPALLSREPGRTQLYRHPPWLDQGRRRLVLRPALQSAAYRLQSLGAWWPVALVGRWPNPPGVLVPAHTASSGPR